MSSVESKWQELSDVTRILREPGGCNWDRAQDKETMRVFLLEEAYEVVEAINRGDRDAVREELGDLLFVVFFFSRLYEEEGSFSLEDVLGGVADKLVRRHPHVFGPEGEKDVAAILRNWEKIKKDEKPGKRMEREGFLPALMRAQKVQEKAARQGFDWNEAEDVLPHLESELDEFKETVRNNDDHARKEDESGDILFTIVNCLRHMQIQPEIALHRSTDKFQDRFAKMIESSGETFADLTLEEKESLWKASKSS